MMSAYLKVLLFGIFLCITACSLLSPVESSPQNSYLLSYDESRNLNSLKKFSPTRGEVILVSPITAVPWLDTSQMAYQKTTNQLDYFAKNAWAAKPAELLQPIIVEVLQTSGKFKAVLTSPYNGNVDKKMEIKILECQQVFTQHPSYFVIHLQVRVIQQSTQQVLVSRDYRFTLPCQSENPEGGVKAANQIINQYVPAWINAVNAKKLA
jgi:cholesterol transport system auxiliary component